MANRCVWIGGALVRVSDKFDATEGSADMKALQEVMEAARQAFDRTPQIKPHPFERDETSHRALCKVCRRGTLASVHRASDVGPSE